MLNRHSAENGSDTPDFILAQYLMSCLGAWNRGIAQREHWYGRASQTVPAPSSLSSGIVFSGQACSDGGEHIWCVRPTADASGRVERYCLKCNVVRGA